MFFLVNPLFYQTGNIVLGCNNRCGSQCLRCGNLGW